MNILNKSLHRRNISILKRTLPLFTSGMKYALNGLKTFSSKVTLTRNGLLRENESQIFYIKKNSFSSSKRIIIYNLELPRHITLTMPNLSPTMAQVFLVLNQGNIVSWNKKEGDAIKSGDVLASIETDKAQVDFEVNEDGFVAKLLFSAGSKDVKIGTVKIF